MKISKAQIFSWSVLGACLAISSACTTLFKDKDTATAKDELVIQEKNAVVQQVGRQEPAISKFNKDYWLDVRSATTKPELKLYATLATGAADVAELDARAYLQSNPNNFTALIVLASALTLQRKYELASYYADLIEKTYPGRSETTNIQGLSAMLASKAKIADYHQALKYFRQSFDASSEQIASGLNLAHLELELGNAQAAAQDFKAVSERCGGCSQGFMGYGIAKSRLADYKEADRAFTAVLAQEPHHPEALYHLALVHKNGYNDYKAAAKSLRQLLAHTSSSQSSIRQRASSVLRIMQAEAARTGVDTREEIAQDDDEEQVKALLTSSPDKEE